MKQERVEKRRDVAECKATSEGRELRLETVEAADRVGEVLFVPLEGDVGGGDLKGAVSDLRGGKKGESVSELQFFGRRNRNYMRTSFQTGGS